MNAAARMIPEPIKTLALCASVFVLAFAVRAWTNTWLTDFWGDSYHHWLITRLTMLQGGVYSDYKGLEVVWSPFYHYLSIVPLLISGRGDIVPLHWMNTFWGASACALCALLAWRLYANRVAAFTAGALLAFMSWHIAFSGMNVAEVFSGVLVLSIALSVTGACSPPPTTAALPIRVRRGEALRLAAIFLCALLMPLTRTDLSIYLAIVVLWLWIQKRFVEAWLIIAAVGIALLSWSEWSYLKTGNFLYWYQQYTQNNLHDWLLLNEPSANAALTFADYLNKLSPDVFPALVAGVLTALSGTGRHRRARWLVTALLAAHVLFLIIGYTQGIVPLLTERYLALDLPLVAVLMGGWVLLVTDWVAQQVGHRQSMAPPDTTGELQAGGIGTKKGQSQVALLSVYPLALYVSAASAGSVSRHLRNSPTVTPDPSSKPLALRVAAVLVALLLLATNWFRFQNDIPELEIRRWGIDPEWQIGNFLSAQVQPGDVVLTDAPVAIYRSGKELTQFVSSVELDKVGDPAAALRRYNVRWIVVQPLSYDAASNYIPRPLLQAQTSGTVNGLEYDLVWRYDPKKTDIQSQVWHVIQAAEP